MNLKTLKDSLKNYLTIGLPIIFSVLFALFINDWAERAKTNEKKQIALASIQTELLQNQKVITRWFTKHQQFKEKLTEITSGQNDSLAQALYASNFLNIAVITNNEQIIDAFLLDAAWQSAQITQIIGEFDFQTTQKLTEAYSLQRILMEKTVDRILNLYFDKESHKIENKEAVLVQFQLRLQELIGQEQLLQYFYQEALKDLK